MLDKHLYFADYIVSATEIRYDISLLKLQGTVQFTDYILPACLPLQNEEVLQGAECWITGRGRTQSRFMPSSGQLWFQISMSLKFL